MHTFLPAPGRPEGRPMTPARTARPHGVATIDSAVAALRAGGLRVSAARRLVLEALFAAEGPATVEELAAGFGGRVPPSDVASTYRNLETLEALGLVRHMHLGHGPGRYVLARPRGARLPRVRALRRPARRGRRRPRAGSRARARGVRLRGALRPLPDRRAVPGLREGMTRHDSDAFGRSLSATRVGAASAAWPRSSSGCTWSAGSRCSRSSCRTTTASARRCSASGSA